MNLDSELELFFWNPYLNIELERFETALKFSKEKWFLD